MKSFLSVVLETCKNLGLIWLLTWPSNILAATPDRTTSTYKYWTVQCFNTLDANGVATDSACELFQDIGDPVSGGRVLRILVATLADTEGVRVSFLTPIGVDLHQYFSWAVRFESGDDEFREDLFRVCRATGCSVSFDLKTTDFEKILSAQSLEISFSLLDQTKPLTISAPLNGLGDAFGNLSDAP